MAGPDEERLRAVEQGVAELREEVALARADAGAARVLAAGADRDVSEVRAELRAHTRALSALRETQLEHGAHLARLDGRIDGLESEVRRGFATLGAGMAEITRLLTDRG